MKIKIIFQSIYKACKTLKNLRYSLNIGLIYSSTYSSNEYDEQHKLLYTKLKTNKIIE